VRKVIEKRSTRWFRQRRLMDAVLETIGVERDQARLAHYSKVAGAEAAGVFRAAGAFVVHEPGCDTIFNAASPTFRTRFIFMAGIDDEDAFDSCLQDFDPRGVVGDITRPVPIVAGEDDELSPIECTHDLYDRITAPKKLVVYEGASHGIGGASSVTLGESPGNLIDDWHADGCPSACSDRHVRQPPDAVIPDGCWRLAATGGRRY